MSKNQILTQIPPGLYHQISFRPSWIERAPPVPSTGLGAAWSGVLQAQPKLPLKPVEGSLKPALAGPLGSEKFTWLRTLKNSARNWAVRRSLIFVSLTRDKSQFLKPKSGKTLRRTSPTVPNAGGSSTEFPAK